MPVVADRFVIVTESPTDAPFFRTATVGSLSASVGTIVSGLRV
jgi:hypothetical protein